MRSSLVYKIVKPREGEIAVISREGKEASSLFNCMIKLKDEENCYDHGLVFIYALHFVCTNQRGNQKLASTVGVGQE